MSRESGTAGPATAAETALAAGEKSAGTILVIVLLAICAPVFAAITRLGPDQQFINIGENASGGPVPPGGIFWYGTDSNGRDLFVRVIYGARISLVVGVLATAISVALGVVFGLPRGAPRRVRGQPHRPGHRRAAVDPAPAHRHLRRRTAVRAINQQDLPVIVGIVVLAAALVVLANVLVDVIYALLDPRPVALTPEQ